MLTIQKFILFLVFILLFIFYITFTYFFFKQEEEVANVILKSLKNNMSETSYTLSKNIREKEDILSFRALLDRITSNEDFIKAILVFDDDKLLLSTEPSLKDTNRNSIEFKNMQTAIKQLTNTKFLEEDITYYQGKNHKTLQLIYVLEEDEINSHFVKNKLNFGLYFGLLPILTFGFLFLLLRIYISKPLEILRQYAYYNHDIPNPFKLRELEAIRHSMVDTLSRLESEKKELYLMARTDSLSGLANRNSLNEFLEKLIPTYLRNKKEFAYLFLDIDHFKTVNDSLGHNIGDELLQNISSIIKKALRPNDFVARVGGDEFVIILQDYHSYMEVSNIIKRIQLQLSRPWIVQKSSINISCSIGVSFYPKDANDIITLMKNADIAMYEAKKLGRNQYHFFTESLNDSVQKTIALEKNMKEALKQNEYKLYYQPKVDLISSKIIGAEALIRWISPQNGFISPNDFIPLAEENGFIKELGSWIIKEAINQHLKWRDLGIDISISINISPKQLLDEIFVSDFISLLEKHNINPKKIDIEITEYMFVQHSVQTNNNLNRLHDFGITVSLDDFGTGYSSLSYLKKFPIDYLKIDKTFLDDFNSVDGAIFLETIVKLGQMLKMKVIAEGVETQEQIDYLKNISCDQIQGYYFSKPLPSEDFEKLYKKGFIK